ETRLLHLHTLLPGPELGFHKHRCTLESPKADCFFPRVPWAPPPLKRNPGHRSEEFLRGPYEDDRQLPFRESPESVRHIRTVWSTGCVRPLEASNSAWPARPDERWSESGPAATAGYRETLSWHCRSSTRTEENPQLLLHLIPSKRQDEAECSSVCC